jgi:two-component system response regulator PhcR
MPDLLPPRTGPLVVYVDDEHANRVVFQQSLADEFRIQTCADAASALELLATEEVAVLVTDMRMPAMSGEELLRIAKQRHPQTTRMVVTAFADVEPILRAINEGLVARYIIKPWELPELVQVLRWAIETWTFSRDSAVLHRRLLETERLAMLGSVASMAIHDLKQPLTSMLINIDLLQELATYTPMLRRALYESSLPLADRARVDQLVEELTANTGDLKTTTDHVVSVVKSLGGFSRPRGSEVAQPTNPLPVVRHAMAVCHQLAIIARTQLDYRGPHVLPPVRMGATELTQVLINVLSNGAQAVAARGAPNGNVVVVARTDGGVLEIQVRDDGVGMPPEVLGRIGTPFFTTRSDGTGLGLSQCQRLIGATGGRFQIESEVGKGTTVTIQIPIAA